VSASSPKISLTKGPAPTALEYALTTVVTLSILYGGMPAPTDAKPANVDDDVVKG